MQRPALIALLLVFATRADASPPSGYQCAPGSPKRGAGCTCPKGFASTRDDANVALCEAVKLPAPAPVAPPTPPTREPVRTPPPAAKPNPGEPVVRVTITATKQPASSAKVKPDVSADQLALGGIERRGTIRPEQEKILEELIQVTPDSDFEEKADYLYRLAELQTALAQTSKNYIAKAIKNYTALLDNERFRNYPRLDQATFSLAYLLQSNGSQKEARAAYMKLVKNYPTSKYVPDAYLAFADYFLDANQLPEAEESYKQVLKYPKAPAYWYAMYRLGWVYLGTKRYQEALEAFFQVVQATKPKPDALTAAAKFDFVRAYAEIGKPEMAVPAFKRVDRDAAAMVELLVNLYVERGQADKAVRVLEALLTTDDVCAVMARIARANAYAATPKDVEVCVRDVPALKEWTASRAGTFRTN